MIVFMRVNLFVIFSGGSCLLPEHCRSPMFLSLTVDVRSIIFLGFVFVNASYIVSISLEFPILLTIFILIHVGITKAWPTTTMLFLFLQILHSRRRGNGWR